METALKTAKVSGGDEQDFVDRLRVSGNYLPELALVAEENGELLGHVMLTRTSVVDGEFIHEVLLLAPLSVVLEHRCRGIGAKLTRAVLAKAKELGYPAVLLVGDPAYYSRFGFRPAAEFGIRNPEIPEQYVQALELYPEALDQVKGVTSCC